MGTLGSGAVAVAKYWKNGQAIPLTDGTRQAYANCISISGSDVYVAGQESANSTPFYIASNYIAKYWKNGVAVLLTNASSDAWANSITVVDNNVYVAGYENGIAKYWKNGQSVSLSQGECDFHCRCWQRRICCRISPTGAREFNS